MAPGTEPEVAGRQKTTFAFLRTKRAAYTVLLISAAALVALHFWFMSANSATSDEFVQIESGYRQLQCGDYAVTPENPPLAKLVAAFPIRRWQLSGFMFPCGSQVTPSRGPDFFIATNILTSPNAPALLWEARAAMLVFPLALLVMVFFAARSFFGYTAAAFAAVLLAFEPSLIAHGSLATLDMAFATCMFAVSWAAYEYASKPSPVRLVILGLAMGLALASKFLALTLPFTVLVLILLPDVRRPVPWNNVLKKAGAWIGASVIAWIVVWGVYGFRYSALPHSTKANYDLTALFGSVGMSQGLWLAVTSFLARFHLLPEAYIAGAATMKTFDASPAYLFGNAYPEGLWYYYPIALLIKLTIPVMALALIAVASRRLWRANRRAVLTVLFSILPVLGLAMIGKVNMGIRHVLPVYPLLIVLAAAGAAVLVQRSRAGAIIGVALICFHVVSSLWSAPGQISYANELAGGPNNLYKLLVDSNLDWGQSDAQLTTYIKSHHPENCAIAWSFPHRSSPPCIGLASFVNDLMTPNTPALPDTYTGAILIEPTAVIWSDAYLSFLRRKPNEIFAHGSVLVYRGTFDLRAIAASRHVVRGLKMMFFAHDAEHALGEFAAAEPYCATSDRPPLEHFYGMALLQLHRPAEAKVHLEKLLQLSEGHDGLRSDHEFALQALGRLANKAGA